MNVNNRTPTTATAKPKEAFSSGHMTSIATASPGVADLVQDGWVDSLSGGLLTMDGTSTGSHFALLVQDL
jgi:hypothetical protein